MHETKKENKEKRVPKNTPKLKVELSEEQKEVVKLFYEYDVTFIHGDFGSGKTLSAVHTALTHFNKRQCEYIWLVRPMLKNQLAALPGSLEDKLAPYVYPLQQNLEVCQGKLQTEKMMKEGIIKIMPVEVAKGCSFMESVVVVDEYQDMDYQDFRTILTRLSKGSKMIFCGSKQQIDRQINEKSCIFKTMKLEELGLVGYTTLKSNHRNPILTDIIDFLENNLHS
jgi:phosphate starvation-inducible PhoH-like protein